MNGMDRPRVRAIGAHRLWLKRCMDVLASLAVLILAAPLFAIIAVLVRTNLGSPAIFRQERPGLHGRPFVLLKFRTMTNELDAAGNPLPDEARLTRFGHFLRSASLDELPEFWNVLRGDMSLVGPRPLLMRYLDLYSAEQFRRHEMRPGLTGWAQIHGRNQLDWPERLRLDVWYIDNMSLRLDAVILARTAAVVLRRQGISTDGLATGSEFSIQ